MRGGTQENGNSLRVLTEVCNKNPLCKRNSRSDSLNRRAHFV